MRSATSTATIGPVRDVIRTPRHPYTIGLLSTRGHGGRLSGTRLPTIAGSPPDLANLPPGCAFAPRCMLAADPCRAHQPEEVLLGSGHAVRCLRTDATIVPAQAISA
jgi:peptide/nickel transport system ATP-binding protein